MLPKKLSIEEAWRIYRLMEDCLQVTDSTMIADIVIKIIKKVPQASIFEVLQILYGENVKIKPPYTLSSMLINGLQYNGMDTFYQNVTRIISYGDDSR